MLVKDLARDDAKDVLDSVDDMSYPVPVEWIASSLGIVVHRFILPEDVSGMLRVEPGRAPEVYVDSNDTSERQRFTIAHEIGHYIERTTNQPEGPGVDDFNFVDRRSQTNYDLHEFYADEFAGNLLMPATEVRRLLNDGARSVRLARHFGVSLPAVRRRLDRLEQG